MKQPDLKRLLLIPAMVLTTSAWIYSQPIPEKVHAPNIKTVKIHKQDEPLSPPVIVLHSGSQIQLSFDDLEGSSKNFSYKLIHCNASWEPSDLFDSDYISGQFTGEIYHHESSFNTLKSYTHYRLNIPNETMRPTKSGNYTLMVYENYSPEDTILTRRFRVSEGNAQIRGRVDRINRMSPDQPNQEINISIQTGTVNLHDPYNNLKMTILKNYHTERYLEYLTPSSISGNTISYQMHKKLRFKGGNEFHHFNSKNTDFPGEHIKNIRFLRNNFHFQLNADQNRTYKAYQIKNDLNGRFSIDKERADNPGTEADYVYVYFTLKGVPFDPEGHYYVAGSFNNWQYNRKNRMTYDPDERIYQKRLLLKQGYYDYKYVYRSEQTFDPYRISGNHPQTENDYLIYVYYRDYAKGYDRLIGHTLINTSAIDY